MTRSLMASAAPFSKLSAALFSKRAVLEGTSPACVSMTFCDNPAAVIMTLLEALDEKTQARMMPIYSKLLEPNSYGNLGR